MYLKDYVLRTYNGAVWYVHALNLAVLVLLFVALSVLGFVDRFGVYEFCLSPHWRYTVKTYFTYVLLTKSSVVDVLLLLALVVYDCVELAFLASHDGYPVQLVTVMFNMLLGSVSAIILFHLINMRLYDALNKRFSLICGFLWVYLILHFLIEIADFGCKDSEASVVSIIAEELFADAVFYLILTVKMYDAVKLKKGKPSWMYLILIALPPLVSCVVKGYIVYFREIHLDDTAKEPTVIYCVLSVVDDSISFLTYLIMYFILEHEKIHQFKSACEAEAEIQEDNSCVELSASDGIELMKF